MHADKFLKLYLSHLHKNKKEILNLIKENLCDVLKIINKNNIVLMNVQKIMHRQLNFLAIFYKKNTILIDKYKSLYFELM